MKRNHRKTLTRREWAAITSSRPVVRILRRRDESGRVEAKGVHHQQKRNPTSPQKPDVANVEEK